MVTSDDRYLGCLFGIAIGDALGAPVEFRHISEIHRSYGPSGVSELVQGFYTDDTQMSLATALSLIDTHEARKELDKYSPTLFAYRRYQEWLKTQRDPRQRRSPGGTCLSALAERKMGTIEEHINTSKGCGGVMRTAPVGLAFSPAAAFRYGAEFAAVTHGHPSGYLSAGFLAELVSFLCDGTGLTEAIMYCRITLAEYESHEETLAKVDMAMDLARGSMPSVQAIEQLGGGWVGEEALAISLFCSLRSQSDWKEGVLAAINHSGDSDSTGSITGAILGTLLGVKEIPQAWVHKVERSQYIRETAVQIYECYRASKIEQFTAEKKMSEFPKAFECPICNSPLKADHPGSYRCSNCRTVFTINKQGRFIFD